MKDKRHLFLKLLCFSLVIGATAGGVACKEKTNEPEVPSGYDKTFEEIGSYYADEGETRNTFDLTDSAFSVKIGSAKIEGTYLFNGTTLRLVAADGTVLEAKYNDATITLTYQNKTYKFYKNVEYTVKFEMNGGEAKEDEKVLNGKKLAKPANPVKEEQGKEYVFVGWYKDAAFNEKYSFDQPVTKNITLYARFAELLGKTEFSVTFDGYTGGGQEGTYPVVTTNQTLYNLPVPESENGEEFLGWWRSAYNDKNKLTAQYEAEEPIAENIVLYPVWKSAEKIAVSVKSNKISWSSLGVNKTYELTVKDAEGKVVGGIENRKVSSTEFGEFDFSAQPAGEYTVTVKCGSAETTAYYKNKALARVSAFAVNSPSILTFNAVENAEKYLLTIECGTAEHSHEDIDLGVGEDNKPVTFYDFSDCDMQAGGIRFTVKAVADGMLTSVSETWSFERTLNAATNLAVEDSTQQASWDAVENAKYYLVQVNDGDAINVGDKTSFDLRGYEKGAYSVKVIAVAKGYNNSPAAETEWTKATLPTPANLSVSGYTLNWTAVDGANGYVVKIGEKEIDVTTNSYTLQAEDYVEGQTEYGISVSAKDTAAAGNSLFTKTLTVQSGKIAGELSYEKGFLSWNPGFGVAKYEVQVNDGAITEVKDVGTAVTLTKAGENTLRVRSYDEKGNASAWIEKKVTAYTVSYDVGENERKIDDAYVAVGDSIALPESIFEGYDFGGWYNGQNGAGTKYEEVSGTLPTLGAAEDLTLYAKWTPKQYNVVLNKGAYSDDDLSAGATVSYKEAFELPVPSSNNKNKAFMGWYAGTTQITDYRGESKDVWRYLTGQTLEARWVDVFKFASLVDGSYSVTQADGVKYLTEVTVPTEYNNKRVSTVEAYAFKDAKNLTTINIPESIANIENTAFEGCTGLLNLNIYKVEGTIEPVYYSPVKDNGETDGIIVKNDSAGKTLQFFPLARTGVYTIPSGVETIAANVFTGCKLEVIKIPASVNYVAMNAFKSCTSLTEIEFLQAEDGVEEKLIIADKAFASSYNIKKITLPARLTNMTLFNGEKKNDYTWAYERSAFYGCNRLSEIYVTGTVSTGRLYSSSENGLLLNADGTELLYWAQGRTETEVALPSSVTKIADKAFYGNKKITTFIVPARIVEIGESAFENCENLATLTFEGTEADAALEIKERAFYGCNITELTLTENVRTIGKYAFGAAGLSGKLETVTVKSSGEVSFADGAFASFSRNFTTGEITGTYASSVITLNIGKDVPVINISGAFGGTSSKLATVNVDKDNKYYLEEESVIYDKNAEDETKSKTEILYYPVGKQGEYVVPSTVTKIGANVFVARKGLTKITIGNNVTSIGDAAFKGCTNLAEIVWGEPAEGETAKPLTIGERAFEDCDSFVSFTLPARVTALGDMAFYNCDSIVTFDFAANSALKTIGEKAFAGLDKLQTIALPEGVVSVGNYAFSDCENLTKVTFPSTVERLGKWTETTDESGVTTYKFDSMDLFKSESTFIFSTPNYYSKNLEEVEVASGNKYYASKDGMLYGKDESGNPVTLYFCPFKKAGEVSLPNTLTLIYKEAFALNTGVTKVKFDGALAGDFDIGKNALYKASALTTFELPQGLTKIVKGLFKDCSDLTGIVVPNTVTSIEAGAFEGCVSLKDLTFAPGNDDTPLTLEDGEYSSSFSGSSGSDVYTGVFSYYYQGTGSASNKKILKSCVSLTSVQFPKRLAKIGTFAFYKCSGLETVTFAEDCNLTEIGDGAFTDSGLTAISLPGRLTTIGMEAFRGAKFPAGTAINIPASVTEYGKQTTKKSATRGVFGDTSVSKITFADNSLLETVYEQAFYSPELTEVSFGNNSALTTLKSRAFTTCSKLALVNFGENSKLQTIESSAFYNCKALTSATIPATVTTIGKNAFEGCAALTSVTFATYAKTDEETGAVAGKSSLRSIGDQAFLNTGLTSFTFPSTKEPLVAGDLGLGKEMFKGCKKLVTINLSETVQDISKVFDLCGSIKKITVPEGGYFVADGAVLYNVKQTELVYILGDVEGTFNVKDGVTTINPSTFAGKATLKEITIPASVTTIGEKAFYDCLGLKKVTFETNSTLATIGASAFRNCVSLTDITIPVGVTVIDEYTFYNCKSLKTIAVPKNVTMIKKYAFYNCKALETVTLPEGLTNIGYYASSSTGKQSLTSSGGYSFAYCTSLKNINIPSTVQWIQNYSFQNCTSLESVDLNVTDKQLGSNAFENCTALQKVTLNASVKTLPSGIFKGCTALNSVLAAGATEGETPVVDLSQITKFDTSNFENCTAITEVKLSTDSALTQLGDNLFDGCTNLAKINLPDQLTYLGKCTFRNTALTEVRIPDGVTCLGTTATKQYSCSPSSTTDSAVFDGCTKLTRLDLNKVVRIGGLAFRNCPLTDVADTLDLSKVQVFGRGAFAGTGLKKVDLSGVWMKSTGSTAAKPPMGFGDGTYNRTTLETNVEGVFENCKQLTEVTFSDKTGKATLGTTANQTVKVVMGASMFKGCTALESVTLPVSSAAIPACLFYGCTALNSVTIGTKTDITSLGAYAFKDCVNLTSIDLSKVTASTVYDGMFDGCVKLANVTVSATTVSKITTINKYAFRNCVSLVSKVPEGAENVTAFTLEPFTKLTKINEGAFAGCDGLTSVVLPTLASATGKLTVSASAFNGCANLESVSISKNVSSIGAAAFGSCAKLAKITVNSANSYYKALNGVLYTADGAIVCVPAGVEMENYTLKLQEGDTIAAGALDGCVNVKKIVLPEAMTSVADKLFQGLTTLEEVVLSSQTESIGANAFENTGLKKITYTGAEEEAATEGVTALKTSVFPATLKFIGKYAFQNTKLEKVILPATLNGLVLNASGSSISTRTVGDAAFAGSALQSVVIAGSETFFGGSATTKYGVFYNCVNLTRVEFTSNTAAVLGANASLGQNMFSGCTALESVVLPDTEILPSYMFDGCVKLASVNIPASVTELPSGIFRGAAFTEITIPAGITEIKSDAFSGCANLAKVTFNEGLTSIGGSAFSGCVALTSVTLPEGLLTIDGFSGCVNLASINIPSTVTKIYSGTFKNCTALKSIVLPASLESVAFAFEGWTAEQTIYVEAGAADVYNLWATDSDSGFASFLDKSYSGPFYQMDAKIVWNYNASADSSAETEGEGGAA